MAYHIFAKYNSQEGYLLDVYLGSASSVNYYWESIGRKLNLPIIANLTQMADYEDSTLRSDGLIAFLSEMKKFQNYWINESSETELPDGFLRKIDDVIRGTENAIKDGLALVIA